MRPAPPRRFRSSRAIAVRAARRRQRQPASPRPAARTVERGAGFWRSPQVMRSPPPLPPWGARQGYLRSRRDGARSPARAARPRRGLALIAMRHLRARVCLGCGVRPGSRGGQVRGRHAVRQRGDRSRAHRAGVTEAQGLAQNGGRVRVSRGPDARSARRRVPPRRLPPASRRGPPRGTRCARARPAAARSPCCWAYVCPELSSQALSGNWSRACLISASTCSRLGLLFCDSGALAVLTRSASPGTSAGIRERAAAEQLLRGRLGPAPPAGLAAIAFISVARPLSATAARLASSGPEQRRPPRPPRSRWPGRTQSPCVGHPVGGRGARSRANCPSCSVYAEREQVLEQVLPLDGNLPGGTRRTSGQQHGPADVLEAEPTDLLALTWSGPSASCSALACRIPSSGARGEPRTRAAPAAPPSRALVRSRRGPGPNRGVPPAAVSKIRQTRHVSLKV